MDTLERSALNACYFRKWLTAEITFAAANVRLRGEADKISSYMAIRGGTLKKENVNMLRNISSVSPFHNSLI